MASFKDILSGCLLELFFSGKKLINQGFYCLKFIIHLSKPLEDEGKILNSTYSRSSFGLILPRWLRNCHECSANPWKSLFSKSERKTSYEGPLNWLTGIAKQTLLQQALSTAVRLPRPSPFLTCRHTCFSASEGWEWFHSSWFGFSFSHDNGIPF